MMRLAFPHPRAAAALAAGLLATSARFAQAVCPTAFPALPTDARFGATVTLAGDLNADGYPDVAVGAASAESPGNLVPGRVAIYFGGPSIDGVPDLVLNGEANGDRFGFAVARARDLNGDGFDDLAVGAYGHDTTLQDAGRVYVYYGGPGFDAVPDAGLDGQMAGGRFGYSVAGAGDVNGNGANDLLVGQPDPAGGRAFVYFGGAAQWNATPDWTRAGSTTDGLGYRVLGAGDLNGDGQNDIAVTGLRIENGRVYVFFGGPSLDTIPDQTLNSEFAMSYFGFGLASGDINQDGYSDLFVGAPFRNFTTGRVLVFLGGPVFNSFVDFVFDGAPNDHLGTAVAFGADWNGDGGPDLFMGAPDGPGGGRVLVAYGGTALDAVVDGVLGCPSYQGQLGAAVDAGPFDVNADGTHDLLLGMPNSSATAAGAGRASLGIACVEVTCPAPVVTGPGTQVPLQFTVRNSGWAQASIDWSLQDQRGYCSPAAGTLILESGATTVVDAICAMPAGEPCRSDAITFRTAQTGCNDEQQCSTAVTVSVAPPILQCPPPLTFTSGDTVSAHYCMRNPNAVAATFVYDLRPGPAAPQTTGTVTLAPNETLCFDPRWYLPVSSCTQTQGYFEAHPAGCNGVTCRPTIYVLSDDVTIQCARDTTMPGASAAMRRFCFTGPGPQSDVVGALIYTSTNDLEWCAPVTGAVLDFGETHCIDIPCAVPQGLAVPAESHITFSVRPSLPLSSCPWDVTSCRSTLRGVPAVVPVLLDSWRADRGPHEVQMAWRFASSVAAALESVMLERAVAPEGPYEQIAILAAVPEMRAVDRDVEPGRAYWYRVVLESRTRGMEPIGPFAVSAYEAAVRGGIIALREAGPFVRIDYSVGTQPAGDRTTFEVFNIAGRRVTRFDGEASSGVHTLFWDRSTPSGRAPRGLYLIRMQSAGQRHARKLALTGP